MEVKQKQLTTSIQRAKLTISGSLQEALILSQHSHRVTFGGLYEMV